MSVSKGNPQISINDILSKVTEYSILSFYLNIPRIPCVINSPLREDKNPSFGIYSTNNKVKFVDLATKERGDLYDLLCKMWGCTYTEVLNKIYRDITKISSSVPTSYTKSTSNDIKHVSFTDKSSIQCKVRDWRDYDLEYWGSFGITRKWLEYADVYPISHKIVIKDNKTYTFKADKYAYAYIERKEGNITIKIYQPFNKIGYKWANKHDRSVISLWTKVPEYGDRICICSSLKDALCLWSNTGIPSIAIQGEGYDISQTAIHELRRRYKNIYILLDNDSEGIKDALKLSELTGFINIVLPKLSEYGNPKDISDLFKAINNKEKFTNIILNLFTL